jgi:hypothetical protein
MVVTLEVSNPGTKTVKTLKPFIHDTGCLFFRTADPGSRVGPALRPRGLSDLSPNGCDSIRVRGSNTTTFAPGEIRRLILRSYDLALDTDLPSVNWAVGTPTRAGEYGITYWYGTTQGTAPYTVAGAELEADALVAIPAAADPYLHVIALRSAGTSYICVPYRATSQPGHIAAKQALPASFDHNRVLSMIATNFKRAASSANPVAALSVTADTDRKLSIQWIDSSGTSGHVTVRHPIKSSGEIEIL